ncbi:MAG: hypothetical protein ACM31C_17630 [Acidobacteriota bacterium]
MRSLWLVCLACGVAHGDPLVVGVGAHHAIVDEGGDHGSWNGAALELEHALSPHLALRGQLAFDSVVNHSDAAPYAYDANELVAMVGLRVDVTRRDERRAARVYFAAALGEAYMWIDDHPAMVSATSLRLEPLAAGAELMIGDHDAVRVEAGAMLYHQFEDALALVVGAAYVHAF